MNPYTHPTYVRTVLRNLDIRPARGMGQNFLVNQAVLDQIVAAADLHPDDLVIEVGPGLGVLTWELLQRAGEVIVVELDRRLVARLHQEFSGQLAAHTPLHIIQGDILKHAPAAIFQQAGLATEVPDRGYKVVANLPYAITAPVLRHFLEQHPQPHVLVVLVQWEVAQRITAQPGDLSVLAHAVQMYAQPEIVGRVRAEHFIPEPAVDSAILRLHIRPAPAVDVTDADMDGFFRVIKAGFLHARKKLSNALPSGLAAMGKRTERETVLAALDQAGVSPDRRAETLTLHEWARVVAALHESDER